MESPPHADTGRAAMTAGGPSSARIAGLKVAGRSKARAAVEASGPMDAACMRWLGIPVSHAGRIVVLGLIVGAAMETFMAKVWIGKTNFYEVVKRKEAERRAEERTATTSTEPSFAEMVRQQWEEKKKQRDAQAE